MPPGGRLAWSTDETSTRRPEEPSIVAPQLFDGDYHHVAATWDQSTVAVYVGGVSVSPNGPRMYLSSQRGRSGPSGGGITYEITGPFRLDSSPPPTTTIPARSAN